MLMMLTPDVDAVGGAKKRLQTRHGVSDIRGNLNCGKSAFHTSLNPSVQRSCAVYKDQRGLPIIQKRLPVQIQAGGDQYSGLRTESGHISNIPPVYSHLL